MANKLSEKDVSARVEAFQESYRRIKQEISRMIVGQEDIIDGILICLFCGGHALLEGIPGLGKTSIIKSLGEALALDTSRVQFTPDLMPADIIGTNILLQDEQGKRHFQFQKGPLFANIVLADEINRATPKTQSALLEAMQEQRITVSGKTYRLPPPFMGTSTASVLISTIFPFKGKVGAAPSKIRISFFLKVSSASFICVSTTRG